jgi:hypothetical protein
MVRRIGVLVFCLLTSPAALVASPPLSPLIIVVYLENYAPVDKHTLSSAKGETARVFKEMGIRIEWRAQWVVGDLNAPAFNVVLLSPPMATEMSRSDAVAENSLAISSKTTGRAYVFYARLCQVAKQDALPEGLLLAEVLNHELGHMIADLGHGSMGIMRKFLETKSEAGFFGFTRDQQVAIRTALAGAMKADVPKLALRAAPDSIR